jgi:hypothetical protein
MGEVFDRLKGALADRWWAVRRTGGQAVRRSSLRGAQRRSNPADYLRALEEVLRMSLRLSITLLLGLIACNTEDQGAQRRRSASKDSAYAGVQARGETAMGVDQYTSTHRFEPVADGGRVELQRDVADSAGTAQIRNHMRQIAARFAAGDFKLPGFVHARMVPGTAVMAAKQDVITYRVESLPRGAVLRIRSDDTAAVRAIHQFLAFQRKDHHSR